MLFALQKTMPGISQPFPNIFDPLSFLSNAGSSNTAVRDLKRWRESEITHGRVAMLVSLHLLIDRVIAFCVAHCKSPIATALVKYLHLGKLAVSSDVSHLLHLSGAVES